MTGKFKNLKDKLEDDTLDLSLCDLEQVPVKEIAALRRFTHLDLSNNSLVTLPKTFATLTQIVKLDLSKNMLTEIPDNFGDLRQLRHLDLYSNKISRLPLSLGELKNLKWLDLKENPLTPAVASIAGPCSNSSECQSCARNIVNYLANIKLTIEEEKQRRLQASPEIKKEAGVKKDGKKKKKNNGKKNSEKEQLVNCNSTEYERKDENMMFEILDSNSNTTSKQTWNDNSKGGICTVLCRAFFCSIALFSFFLFLGLISLAIFPMIDPKHSDEAFKYIERETKLPVRQYHHEATVVFEKLIYNAKGWFYYIKNFAEKYYEENFFKEASFKKE